MRVIQSEQIWRFVRAIMTLLKIFPQTRYPAQMLLDLVIDPLQSMLNGVINYLPSLFFLIILFLVTHYVLRLLYGFFDAVNHQNLRFRNFEAEWAWPTYRIVRIGETIGDVLDSRLLVTHIRSLKNEMVIIPNSTILNSEIINYSTHYCTNTDSCVSSSIHTIITRVMCYTYTVLIRKDLFS